MNSNYPTGIDSFQDKQNRLGATYDPTNTEVFYAEDINKITDAIEKIENTLGLSPQSSSADVATRLNTIQNNLPAYSTYSGTIMYGIKYNVRKYGKMVVFQTTSNPTSNMVASGTSGEKIPEAYRPNFRVACMARNGANAGAKPGVAYFNTNGTVGWWCSEAVGTNEFTINAVWIKN